MNDIQNEVIDIVYAAIRELNYQLSEESKLTEELNTIIVGEGGGLDSLGLVMLLVNIEQALFEKKKLTVSLLDELTTEHTGEHPFHSVNSLVCWIVEISSITRKVG
jgi:acyl carrier protein